MSNSMSYTYQHINKVNYDNYKGRGYTGLVNLGNTCFMNSCLQCLSHTYPLRDLLTNSTFTETKLKHMKDGVLIKEWADLNNLMWSENCTVSCDRWVECVQKEAHKQGRHLFTGFDQNDCAEFLMFVLDSFHESIKRKVTMTIQGTPINAKDKTAVKCFNKIKEMYEKEYSEMINIFFGVQIMRIRNAIDNSVIYVENPEPFFVLNAPIPDDDKKTFMLNDCFDLMLEKEMLSGDNAWYNEEKKIKEDVFIEHSFWNLPNVLIVCLKRFNNYGKKINKYLTYDAMGGINSNDNFSIYVNLSKYVENHDADSYKYEVYGFCIHSGVSMGGHYVSVVKTADNQWCIFNDQDIKKIERPSMHIPSLYERGYCLFLRKI